MPSLPISTLRAHPHNPRKGFDEEHIGELCESLKTHGLIDSVVVRQSPDGTYEIISGHCRVEAARRLGWPEVRCVIRPLDDKNAELVMLEANLIRRSLSELEEAEAIHRLIETYGLSQAQVAEKLGKTQSWVSYRHSLLKLHPEVKEQVMTHVITPSHGKEIAKAPQDVQPQLAQSAAASGLSVQETGRLVGMITDQTVPEEAKEAALKDPKAAIAHQPPAPPTPPKVETRAKTDALASPPAPAPAPAPEPPKAPEQAPAQPPGPASLLGAMYEDREKVIPQLSKAKGALERIEAGDVRKLKGRDLDDAERIIQDVGELLNEVAQWVGQARQIEQGKPKKAAAGGSAKVLSFRGTRPG